MIGWQYKTAALLSLMMLGLSGCVLEMEDPDECVQGTGGDSRSFVEVRFDVRKTRSSLSPDESAVSNINLYAFCDGKLTAEGYFNDGDPLALKLLYGHQYNLYALANVGQIKACLDEEQFRRECVCAEAGLLSVGECFPMAWSTGGFVVDSRVGRVSVDFSRLVAKVFFSVDKDALSGLEIKSVRVRQAPRTLWPFRFLDGSRVTNEEDVEDGDYASADDLEALNDGGQVFFYVLENCQGCLLEGNTDPWAKTPENISGYAGLCTYLEVDCTFKDGYFYSGDVTYRLYLGNDSLTDFNVRRNSTLDVSLFLTNDALKMVSWRVEADVAVNDGYAGGWQISGRHAVDDLYVGEKISYSVWVKEEVMNHLGGDIGKARLCVLDESGNDVIENLFDQSAFVQEDYDEGISYFVVDLLCKGLGGGTLGLVDEKGEILARMDEVLVQKPRILPSEASVYEDDEVVQTDIGRLELPINAGAQMFCLYLVDKEGYNLNSSQGEGFELSLFAPSVQVDGVDDLLKGAFVVQTSLGESGNDGPFANVAVSCVNDGSSRNRSLEMMNSVTEREIYNLLLNEVNFDIDGRLRMNLTNLPVTLTLVDNGWAGYADCQLSAIVDNPSNLPLKVQCWQLNLASDDYNAITRNEIVDLYGKEFVRTCYDYVYGAYSSGKMPIYCSYAFFSADKSGVYPLPSISTKAIYNSLQYDYMGQSALSHHMDVSFENGASVTGLKAVDNLSDGSMTYGVIYGTPDGWNNRGIWLYSAGDLISKPNTDFDDLPGVTPYSLEEMDSGMMGEISVVYDAATNRLSAAVTSTAISGALLNVDIVVNASGYVQTTPNGTWGKKVDNYCTARVARQVENIVLDKTAVVVDGNALNDALNAIYAQTFFDSYNKVGSSNSYDHHAHPTSFEVSLRFSLAGDSADMMIPITVTTSSQTSFYHGQEGVNYSVSVKMNKTVNRIAFVGNLYY